MIGRDRGSAVVARSAALLAAVALLSTAAPGCARAQEGGGEGEPEEAGFVEERRALVESLAEEGRLPPVRDSLVLEAMEEVPRHRFVPDRLRSMAYADRPLPIGQGQTISQPYIVARMTELLRLTPGEKVLEVGTGSGYQAAVLAAITDSVYSVEIIPELARSARQRLKELGYGQVEVRIGNGWYGWRAHAPYDVIVVTAAPEEVPEPLVEQLAPGGRMVIPVGPQEGTQRLLLVERAADGTLTRRPLDPVRFVPLIREGGTGSDSADSGGSSPAGGGASEGASEAPSGPSATDRSGSPGTRSARPNP